ncbi:MAG: hypothetical protein AAFO95_22895 [Cyanobacteria bacterium J06600_6]
MALWLYYLCTFFIIILIRYFIVAGSAYWLLSSFIHQTLAEQTAETKHKRQKLIKKDISLSVAAAVATAICAAVVMTIYDSGATRLYTSIEEHGFEERSPANFQGVRV